MKPIITLILIAISIVLFSCGDKSTGTSPSNDYFPNEVGSVWVYAVYDSLTEQSYDMTISIADTATLWDMPVTLWVFAGDENTDTMYVSVEDDTVTFHAVRSQGLAKRYVFPLSVGNEWDCGQSCAWDYSVDQKGAIDVPARRFANAYDIRGRSGGFNCYGTHSEWFVPHVGPVWIYRHSFCTIGWPMVDLNEIWELKSYQLAN